MAAVMSGEFFSIVGKVQETFKTRRIFKSEQLERLIELRRRWNGEDEVCFKKICFLQQVRNLLARENITYPKNGFKKFQGDHLKGEACLRPIKLRLFCKFQGGGGEMTTYF